MSLIRLREVSSSKSCSVTSAFASNVINLPARTEHFFPSPVTSSTISPVVDVGQQKGNHCPLTSIKTSFMRIPVTPTSATRARNMHESSSCRFNHLFSFSAINCLMPLINSSMTLKTSRNMPRPRSTL